MNPRINSVSALITLASILNLNTSYGLPCFGGYTSGCSGYSDVPSCEGIGGNNGNTSSYVSCSMGSCPGNAEGGNDSHVACFRAPCPVGMPIYWVSEPYINTRIEDIPVGYSPAIGPAVNARLSYNQRSGIPEEASYFSIGTNWSFSMRAYVLDYGGGVRLHRGGANFIDFSDGVPHFRDGAKMQIQTLGQSYILHRTDGGKDIFETGFTNASGQVLHFISQRLDATGNALTFNYSTNSGIFRLTSVTDADGKSTTFYYENTSFSNRITKIIDPFSRTAFLDYDNLGYLTNIVDAAGITNRFVYDTGTDVRRGWITNMITPYGLTSFRYGGTDAENDGYVSSGLNRFVEVTLPTGGRDLYVFRLVSDFMPYTYTNVPSTSPFSNTLDNEDQSGPNSFHWGPLQYAALSTQDIDSLTANDYLLAKLSHWLVEYFGGKVTTTLSLEREPSADGTNPGQYTWYDYPDKNFANNCTGSSGMYSVIARVLPDGSSGFGRLLRNSIGVVTNLVGTYSLPDGSIGLRTNQFIYASNEIDLQQHVGPTGKQVKSNYVNNAYHQADATYDALNQETRYTYNGNRQTTRIERPTGLTTVNTFVNAGDSINRLEKTVDLEISRTNSYTYADGLVKSHTDERSLTVTNFWDNLQRLTGRRFPDGTTISNIYTALDVTASKDRLGYWSHAGYNGIRLKVAETNANGVVTRYGYCECGALLSVTNAWSTPVQFVTSYGYDFQGNRVFTYLPDASITNWFDSLRRRVSEGDAWGYRYFDYNNQGFRTNSENAYGTVQGITFDSEDRPIWVKDANGVIVTNTFDDLGRIRTQTYPDGGVERFGYSARGLVAYTNQLDKITYFAYDEAMRKVAETNANGEVIRYTNNAAGDLLSLTDGKNQITRWAYDEYGRMTNKLDQLGAEILRYKYDPDSRLTNRWSIGKGNTGYAFDPVGNLTVVDYPNSSNTLFWFDALNRVTNMVDASGLTEFAYAVGGQLARERWWLYTLYEDFALTNLYSGRLRTNLMLGDTYGLWTNGFSYDAAKRLTNVTSPSGAFSYILGGSGTASPLIKKLLLPNTSIITNAFDNVARLTKTYLRKNDGTVLDKYDYTYNVGNQRAKVTRTDASIVEYSYDPIGQLTSGDSSVYGEDRGYRYDAAWNLVTRTNNTIPEDFSVNGKNEILDAMGTNCTYDANGNLTTNGVWSFVYDDENQLVRVINTNAGHEVKIELTYDGLGRLRIREVYDTIGAPAPRLELESDPGGGITWYIAGQSYYVYDGMRVIKEQSPISGETFSYTRGTDLSGSLQGAGGIGGLLARTHSDESSFPPITDHAYYHADGNGNITYLVDSNQGLAATYRYDPYGNIISQSGDLADANVYRFSSKALDAKSGLYYYGYRWYSPQLQRWLNRDPLGDNGSLALRLFCDPSDEVSEDELLALWPALDSNLYAMIDNDPINLTDALGLSPSLNPANQAAAAECIETAAGVGRAAKAAAEAAKIAERLRKYEEHMRKLAEAKQRLEKLKKLLERTKGPKAQQPVKDAIKDLIKDIRGHGKEISQKWPEQPQPTVPK